MVWTLLLEWICMAANGNICWTREKFIQDDTNHICRLGLISKPNVHVPCTVLHLDMGQGWKMASKNIGF